jgi:hypothetical protein
MVNRDIEAAVMLLRRAAERLVTVSDEAMMDEESAAMLTLCVGVQRVLSIADELEEVFDD